MNIERPSQPGREQINNQVEDGFPDSNSSDDNERTPLLSKRDEPTWDLPKPSIWIEMAIFANVFLSGFDGTITASTYTLISSEFGAANSASWLTTAYLITSTVFQPLYGRFSDIFGRRAAFFMATVSFMLGCLGCALARKIWLLNAMRALTGIGGGGLVTIATIVNSDLIPFRQRGMYQAAQNVLLGFGAICGASLGGTIADTIGWRWCFLLQVPVSTLALGMGYLVIQDQDHIPTHLNRDIFQELWRKVDITGAILLTSGLSIQLIGLSLGGNELPWSNIWVILSLVSSIVLLALFVLIEAQTKAMPIIPLRMLRGVVPLATQLANVCAGMSAYAFLFMIPLFFQVVLFDSASKAGARLIIPSLATPLGGLVSGVVMSRWGKLAMLVRIGMAFMLVGNALVATFKFENTAWQYSVYLVPANFGQGMAYPSILFSFLSIFDHAEHAVSASTVYLVRSLGTVWGVAITSAILQNVLKARLPSALAGMANKEKMIDEIRHSVGALRNLPPHAQIQARLVYYDAIRLTFVLSASIASIGLFAAFFTRGARLERRS